MTCEEFAPLLDDFVDGALSVAARTRAEGHLADCASCRLLHADLRRVRDVSRKLPRMAPPEHLWASVQLRLDEEDRHEARGAAKESIATERAPRRSWFAWAVPLAAAAVLVLAVTTAYVFMRPAATPVSPATRQASAQPGTSTPTATAAAHPVNNKLVEDVESELQQAITHYEKGMAGLEQVAKEGRSTLDPTVAAIVWKNLDVTDRAIAESRAGVRTQPTSETAQASLFSALRAKVDLLQETVALINQMRQGNQAAAARIVGSAGNKS